MHLPLLSALRERASRQKGPKRSQVPPLFTPTFIALTLAELAYFTAAGLMIPVTPLFASGPLGASESGVGLAVGAWAVSALLLRPLAGISADRRGRRPLLILGALAVAIITAAHVLVTQLAALVALRLLLGAAEAFFFVAAFAALADLAPPTRVGEALSFNSLGIYLGIAVGPLIGELLLARGGFTLAWMGGAALALIAALIAVRVPETAARTGSQEHATPLISRAALGPGLGLFTGIAGMGGFLGFVALYARDIGIDGSQGVLLVFGLTVVGTRLAFARLPDRMPAHRLGSIALALTAAGLVLAGAFGTAAGLYAGTALLAVGVAFTTPAFFAAIFSRVPASERGAASATASVFVDLAFGGGPVLVGLVAGAVTIPAGFAAAALLALAGSFGTWVTRPRAGSPPTPPTPS